MFLSAYGGGQTADFLLAVGKGCLVECQISSSCFFCLIVNFSPILMSKYKTCFLLIVVKVLDSVGYTLNIEWFHSL